MPAFLRTISPLLFIGLLVSQQVQGIDGDLGNPYAQNSNPPASYDGTLDYGGKYEAVPILTMAGSVVLVLGLFVTGVVLGREKKQKSKA